MSRDGPNVVAIAQSFRHPKYAVNVVESRAQQEESWACVLRVGWQHQGGVLDSGFPKDWH